MDNQQIEEKFEKLDTNFAEMRHEMRENFKDIKTSINDLMDIVGFISMNAVSKNEFNELKQEVNGIKQEIHGLKQEVGGLKQEVGGLKQEVGGLKQDSAYFKANMVTKEYLDEKMYELKGELIQATRQDEQRLERLVEVLGKEEILTTMQQNYVMHNKV